MDERNNPSLYVFISYSHKNRAEIAKKIAEDLSEFGYGVFFDEADIEVTKNWDGSLIEGLVKTTKPLENGRFLYLMTDTSVRLNDNFCLNEVAWAVNHKVLIIPVMLQKVEPPLIIYRKWAYSMTEIPNDASYEQHLRNIINFLEKRQEIADGGSIAYLEGILGSIDYSVEKLSASHSFSGRDWLRCHIENWLSDPNGAPVFWIKGLPGTGKSAIAAWLTTFCHYVKAIHFFNYRKNKPVNEMIASLAFQLALGLDEYRVFITHAIQKEEEAVRFRKMSETEFFDFLILRPLKILYSEKKRATPIAILIDALDEAYPTGVKNEVASLLGASENDGLLPSWIRWLVLSRETTEVKRYFQSISLSIRLEDENHQRNDIKDYLERRLKPLFVRKTDEEKKEICRILWEKSEGNFLYVSKVCEEILRTEGENGYPAIDTLKTLPFGLSDWFQRFFERHFGEDFDEKTAQFISVLSVSKEPLPRNLMREMFFCNDRELQSWMNRLGALIIEEEDKIDFFHASVREWLINKDRNVGFFVDQREGHALLASRGWDTLKKYDFSEGETLPYEIRFLGDHLYESVEKPERNPNIREKINVLIHKTFDPVDRLRLPETPLNNLVQHLIDTRQEHEEKCFRNVCALLLEKEENNEVLFNLSIFLRNWSDICHTHGKGRWGRRFLEYVCQILETIVSRNRDQKDWLRELSFVYSKLGNDDMGLQRPSEAKKRHEKGLGIIRQLVENHLENDQWQLDLSYSCLRVGDAERALHAYDKAKEMYVESEKILGNLLKKEEKNVESDYCLCLVHQRFGEIAKVKNEFSLAKAYFDKCRTGIDRIISNNASEAEKICNRRWRRTRYRSLISAGDAEEQLGDIDRARAFYIQALDYIEKMIGSDPTQTIWLFDCAVILKKLWFLEKRETNDEESITYLEREHAVLKSLVKRDPNHMKWVRAYRPSSETLFEMIRDNGEAEKAKEFVREEIRFLQNLIEKGESALEISIERVKAFWRLSQCSESKEEREASLNQAIALLKELREDKTHPEIEQLSKLLLVS